MPAAAMATSRKPIRTTIRRMIIHRTTMATTVITMTSITMTSIATMTIITAIPMLMTTNKGPARPRRRAVARPGAVGETAAQPADDRGGMKDSEAGALYRLVAWLSAPFPRGAFSHSSGIEWAVEAGDIGDAASLRDWLASMLADGPGFCDGVFLAHAPRAASSRDDVALLDIAELASAFVPSRERQLETSAQGRAFIDIARAAWNADGLDAMVAACRTPLVYPVAVGGVRAMHGVPLAPTLHAFLHALVSNWISAASRLVPLGQTDSQ